MSQPPSIAPMTVAGWRYWVALCVASLLGADLGDSMAHVLHLGHWIGVPPVLALFLAAVLLHRRSNITTGVWFWIAVVLLRTVATNLADFADHDLHLFQPVMIGALLLGLVLAGRFAVPTRPDALFWTALFFAGTAGTVLGDDASHRFGLGTASVALGLCVGLGFLLTARGDRAAPARYWPLVLLIRTAGTSIADFLADRSGLGLVGSTAVIAILFVMILGARRQDAVAAPA